MKSPNEYDRQIGFMVRHLRILNGMTQECLADHLGVSFQQIQKYERGQNRISAGRLFQVAQYLRVDVSCFFDGLPRSHQADECQHRKELINDAEDLRLLGASSRCASSATKEALSQLLESLSPKIIEAEDTGDGSIEGLQGTAGQP